MPRLKQLFLLSTVCYALTAVSENNQPKHSGYVPFTIPKAVENHPKKTAAGTAATLYGLKLIYEGIKTSRIQPNSNGAYTLIGTLTCAAGGILTLIGGRMLYKVFSSEEPKAITDLNTAEKITE